jgi:hypothetical protein
MGGRTAGHAIKNPPNGRGGFPWREAQVIDPSGGAHHDLIVQTLRVHAVIHIMDRRKCQHPRPTLRLRHVQAISDYQALHSRSMKFYHGTTSARLEAIVRQGLVPQVSVDNSERTAIYLTDCEDQADEYSVLSCDRRGGRAIILEIDPAMVDHIYLQPDDYDLLGRLLDIGQVEDDCRGVEPSGLEIDERLRPYRRWQDVPWELSLATSNQVAYAATIPPAAITNLASLAAQYGISFSPTPERPAPHTEWEEHDLTDIAEDAQQDRVFTAPGI